jgi:3-hydroxyisobutyrate dehydrogenase-like beta-hydroxyacid dehydrogenase
VAGVGFIGLGQMGGAMAAHLVGVDGGLVVCDVRPEAADELVAAGATATTSVAEVAEASSVISVMVLDDDQVRDVVGQILPAAASGTVVAIHSTIHAETAIELAATAEPHGVAVVDAPVSGGFMGAGAGTLATLVGGTDEAVAACRPSFEAWADLIVHLGPVGAGTRAKLARNLMHFVAFTAALEAARLAEAAGIPIPELAKIVKHTDAITGGPGAILVRDTTDEIEPDSFWHPIMTHTRTLGEKDLVLALELGDQLGVDLPLGRLALERFAANLGVPHHQEVTR